MQAFGATDGGRHDLLLLLLQLAPLRPPRCAQAEHLINVLANKAAGEAVAPFLGYALVETPVRAARSAALGMSGGAGTEEMRCISGGRSRAVPPAVSRGSRPCRRCPPRAPPHCRPVCLRARPARRWGG